MIDRTFLGPSARPRSDVARLQAMRLVGASSQYVSIGDFSAYAFEYNNAFSVAAWLRFTAASTMFVVSKSTSFTTDRGYTFGIRSSGQLYQLITNDFGTSKHIEVRTDAAVNDGFWHHVVMTYSGSGLGSGVSYYLDGVAAATTTLVDALGGLTILNSTPLSLGARVNGATIAQPYSGDLADVGIYSKALSAAEVTAIHHSAGGPDLTDFGPQTNLVGFWRPSFTPGRTTVQDLSPSAHHGTLVGSTQIQIVPRRTPR